MTGSSLLNKTETAANHLKIWGWKRKKTWYFIEIHNDCNNLCSNSCPQANNYKRKTLVFYNSVSSTVCFDVAIKLSKALKPLQCKSSWLRLLLGLTTKPGREEIISEFLTNKEVIKTIFLHSKAKFVYSYMPSCDQGLAYSRFGE